MNAGHVNLGTTFACQHHMDTNLIQIMCDQTLTVGEAEQLSADFAAVENAGTQEAPRTSRRDASSFDLLRTPWPRLRNRLAMAGRTRQP